MTQTGRKDLIEEIQATTNWLEFADRFVKNYGVYYDPYKLWWFWDSKEYCWEIVDDITVLNLVDKALNDQPKTLQSNIKSQIVEALKRRGRLCKPKDPKPTWIQFKDKIIDVETGETFPSTTEYFFVNPIPWSLGEIEDTPEMAKIFGEWVENKDIENEQEREEQKAKDVELLFEILAYCLASEYFIHDIICFTGSGSNGKSKYQDLINKFVGERNACSVELDLLMENRFESSKLYKKLVCTMGETNFNTMRRTSKIKRLTGQDRVGFEFKNKNSFDDTNYAKIIIGTNTLPVSEDKTRGFYRRWLPIRFPNEFPPDQNVLERIPKEEYNNLSRKCVRLLKNLRQQRKFTNEPTIDEKTKIYEEQSNPINTFISENYVKDHNGKIPLFVFHDEYCVFLDKRGYRKQSKNEVKKSLMNDGYEIDTENTTDKAGNPTKWVFIYGVRQKNGLEAF